MKFSIDMNELEQQRYNSIKKSGHYLELDILIGSEKDEHNGKTGKMPVVTTCMHGCSSEDIAALYKILGLIQEHFESEYPMECMLSKIAMGAEHMGTINTKIPHDEED